MKDVEWRISPGALLVLALLWFFDTGGLYCAVLPAVAAHELGHYLCLRLCGRRLRRFSLGLFGLEMDYFGFLTLGREALAIGAGPFFGMAWGALIFAENSYLRLSGGLSLGLSAFNLLPVLPLDGGRLMALAAGERATVISRCISVVLAGAGAYLWLSRGWFSLFAMALWLAWCNFRSIGNAANMNL